jgi:hypothetical protein
VGPLSTWLVTTAGGLSLFLLLLPRRREGPQPVRAESVRAAPVTPVMRAPALANVPAIDDEQVARWLRPSAQEAREYEMPTGPSGAMARRSRGRTRTPRDL